MAAVQPRRRTQAERRESTRARILRAAADCLTERGYAATSTVEVCRRAGVSRGAQLHHFPTREELLAATLTWLYEDIEERVVAGVSALPPGAARGPALVDLMWSLYGSPGFKAVLELWLASTNEPGLRAHLLAVLQRSDQKILPTAARLFADVAARNPEFPALTSLIFQVMQGMALGKAVFGGDEAQSLRPQVLALLKRVVGEAFAEPPAR
jgi:AcrR family transcriptional regulator